MMDRIIRINKRNLKDTKTLLYMMLLTLLSITILLIAFNIGTYLGSYLQCVFN